MISEVLVEVTDKENMPAIFPLSFSKPSSLLSLLIGIFLGLNEIGCGLRTLPPIRYVPLIGTEKKVTTPAVLARALKDPDVSVRVQAVKLLGVLGQSSNEKIKREVAQALGIAIRDREPGIRLLAIERLGEMEEKFSNKYLLITLKDPNPFVREKVMAILADRENRKSAAAKVQAATP